MLTQGDIVLVSLYGHPTAARVLAVVEERALVEHVSPSGYSGLSFVSSHEKPVDLGPRNPSALTVFRTRCRYGYEGLPLQWLRAIGDAQWIGKSRNGPLPSPRELLRQRDEDRERPTQGWEKRPEGWIKYWRGYRLQVIRGGDELRGFVGTIRAGSHPITPTAQAFNLVAAMVHQFARQLGPGAGIPEDHHVS